MMSIDAGLTHGGFYSHFPSKEDLVVAALADALDRGQAALAAAAEEAGVKGIIARFMSAQHRDHPEVGCAAAALAPELARHPEGTRAVLSAKIEERVALIERHLPPTASAEARRRSATAIFATMMGSLQLSRIATDAVAADAILAAGAEAAERLVDTLPTR